MAHKRRQKANATIARSETFPPTSHSRTAIHLQEFSSLPSFPTTAYSPYMAVGEFVQIDVEEASLRKDFENETSERKRNLCVPLLRAALKGDWGAAKALLERYPDDIHVPITLQNDTALHVAAIAKRTPFVKEMMKLTTPEDLELKTKSAMTALHFAARSGMVGVAKEMVEKNNKLPLIRNRYGRTPVQAAARLGYRDMVSYLLTVTSFEQLNTFERIELLLATISTDLYDIALKILENDPTLAIAKDEHGNTALQELARRPFAIGGKSQISVWQRCLNSWFKWICNKASMQTLAHQLVEGLLKEVVILLDNQLSSILVHTHMTLLIEAAKVGNIEFLIILIRSYPDLIWQVDKTYGSLFHVAVLYQHESVFNLIYEIGSSKDYLAMYTVENNDNMLHLAGQLAPSDRLNIVSGVALQMQRELLWFKEIEKIVPPSYLNKKNSNGETPWDVFISTHKVLKKNGEKWMKDTANYCMLVATLIATVVFTAAFTIPGGNNQETGIPIFLKSNWFMVFFISDAIAFFSSSTSILIFLSILTSRYTEADFLKSLPTKLVFGLVTLFISIAGMVLAFSATCFLVYNEKMRWAPIVMISSASVPITLFVLLHYDLWADIIRSTYWSRFLFRPHKDRLF